LRFARALGAYMQFVNRRAMNFGPERETSLVPTPVAGRKYLLYVHIPYCEALCPFCSFHRVEYTLGKALPYFVALREEIRRYHDLGFEFSEVYLGGGTPTVNIEELAETIALIKSLYSIERISTETNPNHLDRERLEILQDCGVNRLSVGVQSFDNELLKNMQRFSNYGSGEQIIERLRGARGLFETLNVDMIFNLPGQSDESLARDLDIIKNQLGVDQVSFYPLMAATATRRRIAKEMGPVTQDHEQAFYETIRAAMTGSYQAGSVWCFSREGDMIDEYIVDHEEYVGVGSGSFSYLNGTMYATTFSIPRYQDLVPRYGTGITRGRELTRLEQHRYHFMTGLFGLSMSRAAAMDRFGESYFRVLWREFLFFRLLGVIADDGDLVRLTDRGMYYWVVMMREFLTGVNRLRDDMRAHIRHELQEYRQRASHPG